MSVSIERAEGKTGRTAIANMLQLYIHDFSDFMPPERRGLLSEEGLFVGYPLEPYFTEPDRLALMVRHGGRLAGFALLDQESHTGAPLDWNMGEFFIARAHRRGGTGTAAARIIFAACPGRWEAAVARRNLPALAFWRRAIEEWSGALDVQETDVISKAWNGLVLRFVAAAQTGLKISHSP